MCKAQKDNRVSLGSRLLSDLRILFANAGNPEALHTETIITRLCAGPQHGLEDDAPWNQLRGEPLRVRGLASLLKPICNQPAEGQCWRPKSPRIPPCRSLGCLGSLPPSDVRISGTSGIHRVTGNEVPVSDSGSSAHVG